MRWVFIDIESRSPVDLIKEGAYKYWKHKDTEAYLLCFAWSDAPDVVDEWRLGEPCPEDLREHLANGGSVWAHNAEFEYLALVHHFAGRLGWPLVDLEQMICTATLARAHGLPGGLDKAARCMELRTKKDMGGHQLMMKVCKPCRINHEGWVYQPLTDEIMEQLSDYCVTDVLTMIALVSALVEVPDELQELMHTSMRINERGARIDVAFAQAAAEAAKIAKDLSHLKVDGLTEGQLHSSTQTVALKAWINRESDLALPNVAVNTLETVQQEDVPPHVWGVIQARLSGRAAATGKYQAAVNGADEQDHRFRGAYLTNGAPATGRFSASRLQTHNMRRDTPKASALKNVRDTVVDGKFNGSLDLLASCVRGMIVPAPGNVLVKADWSQIEARVAPWLFDHLPSAQTVLDVFRSGTDIYVHQAAQMYNVPLGVVTKALRFNGKVAQLALAYQGGWRALDSMAVNNGGEPFGEEEGRRIVELWRTANPWAREAWNTLQEAAIQAVVNPDVEFQAGRIVYLKLPDKPFLTAALPSGRKLYYPFPELEQGKYGLPQVTYKKAMKAPKKGETDWPRNAFYGGLQLENATQATAADPLRDALITLDALDIPVVAHTHDDIVLEVRERDAEKAKRILEGVMQRELSWAQGLPLKAEAEILTRYR